MAVAGKLVNLLFIDNHLTEISHLTKQLRANGYIARDSHATSTGDIQDAAKKAEPDLVFYNPELGEPSLMSVRAALADVGCEPPIIALVHDTELPDRKLLLASGARDGVSSQDLDLAVRVTRRELDDASLRRRNGELELMLKEASERCNGLLDSSRDAIAYVHEGAHVYVNRAFLEMFGYTTSEELEGLPVMNIVIKEDRDRLKTFLRDYSKGQRQTDKIEVSGLRSDESRFQAALTLQPARVEGEPCVQVVFRDTTQNDEVETKIAELNQRDSLTGLYNRQHFKSMLDQSYAEVAHGDGDCALLFIQLNHYGDICQQHGLTTGDEVVKQISQQITNTLGENQLAARYSESVIAVLSPADSIEEASKFGERLRQKVEDLVVEADSRMVTTTCCVGLALLDSHQADAGEVIGLVERACDQARESGGNAVVVHQSSDAAQRKADEEALKAKIGQCLADDQVTLMFQPIASLTGGDGRRFSVRPGIRGEDEELISPEDAFPDAHSLGLLSMIDAWVFGKVADTAVQQEGEEQDLILFVPVSVDGLLNSELVHSLDAIAPQGVSIVVELSEVAAEKYYRQSLQLANKVRSCGAKLALVDFRNTNNAVRLLSLLRPDFVKFCSTVVSDLSSNAETKKFVDETVERLNQSEGQTIASDIVNAQQLAGVWQTGISLIQGDFVAGPREVMEFDFEQFVA